MQISSIEDLDIAIKLLEERKIHTKNKLLGQVEDFKESLKPINLLKSGLHKITEPGDMRSTLLKAVGGLGMGILTKGLIGGKSTSMAGKILKNTVRATVAKTVYNNGDKLKAYSQAIYNNLFSKSKQKKLIL